MKQFVDNLFWKQNPELKRLTVLNPTDFNPPVINKKFFPRSLGLADQSEIIARNEIVRFFFDNPKIADDLQNLNSDIAHSTNGLTRLPIEGNDFLAFYEEKNAYWEKVDALIAKLKGKTNTQRLINFITQLENDKTRLFNTEAELGKRMSESLQRVTKMEGILVFDTQGHISDEVIIGQKSFNSRWAPSYKGKLPKWAKGWFYKITGIQAIVQKMANTKLMKESYRSTLILRFPSELQRDITDGVYSLLFAKRLDLQMKAINEILSENEQEILRYLNNIPTLKVSVEFKYDTQGLSVKLLSIKLNSLTSKAEKYISTSLYGYKGYSPKESALLQKEIDTYQVMLTDAITASKAVDIVSFLEKNCKVKYGESYKVRSNLTDGVFSWSFLDNIYALPENKTISDELNQQRNFFCSGLNELVDIIKVISELKLEAKEKKLPICMPNIITNKVGINFKNLAPINMISQDKKMVPFSFPELNGRMICLTGRHGRGKSVAGNSVLETLWLAQSGLPVFAEEFSFDVKDVIGAVVNDEGNGSTATVFIQKTKNLLENIAKVPSEKSVIFIDEIGKGTQESSGLALGKRLLGTLADKHYSVIFNTQIMDLAKYAQTSVGAKCLKIDKHHQFTPGIGEGEMDQLIKEMGLNKFLNN